MCLYYVYLFVNVAKLVGLTGERGIFGEVVINDQHTTPHVILWGLHALGVFDVGPGSAQRAPVEYIGVLSV